MEQNVIVPLISSNAVGPLGATHLPRLWLKILLHAAGRLPEGYRRGRGGFDSMTTEGLGLDADAFIAYIETERPTYLACEAWVRANGTKVDPASIAAHNETILKRDKPEQSAAELQAQFALPPTLTNSVVLNNIDDWAGVHEQIMAAAR